MKRFVKISWILVCSLLILSCGGPDQRKMKFFDKGKRLYDQGELVKARLEFKNAIQVDPKFAEAHMMLGMVALQEKNWRQAYGSFAKAVELDPQLTDAQLELGKLLLASDQKEEAWKKAELLLGKDPEHQEALLLKAGVLIAEKKGAEAEAILKEFILKHPRKNQAYLMLAGSRLERNDVEGAGKALQELLAFDATDKTARLMLAELLERAGDHAGAAREYEALISLFPEVHTYSLILAKHYSRTGREKDAEQILVNLSEAHPKEETIRLALIQFYHARKRTDAMVEALKAAVRDLPDKYGPSEMLAGHYIQGNQFQDALDVLERFMEGVPEGASHLNALVLKAAIYHHLKRNPEALELVNQVLAKNPGDIKAHKLKGDLLLQKEDYVGAIAEYRQVVNQEPNSVPASLDLAKAHISNKEFQLARQVYTKVLERNPDHTQTRLELADLHGHMQNPKLAMQELRRVIQTEPDHPKALTQLGAISLAEKDTKGARDYFSRLLNLEPDSPWTYYRISLVSLAEKREAEAKGYLEEALKKDPGFYPGLKQLTSIMVNNGQLDEAMARCRKQLNLKPDHAGFHLLMGNLHHLKREIEPARESFGRALILEPESQEVLLWVTQIERGGKSIDGAIRSYEGLREKHPENLNFARLIATLYEQIGRPAQAKGYYELILEKDPQSTMAANNLAFYYAEYEPTEANLLKAENLMKPLFPGFARMPHVVDTQAWIWYRKGDYEKARDLLLGLEETSRDAPPIHYHLGMIFHQLGDKENARTHLEKAVKAPQDFPGLEEAKKVLKELS